MPAGGREKYGVLHIRAGDKSNWHPLFMGTTQNMMDVIKQHLEGIHTCYIITDDVNCLERFHFDEGFFKRAPDMEDHNLAMLRDFKLLLEAQWIVQHAENGWSAFSNIPACLRGIPIINTYPKIGQNLLDSFRKLKGLPGEFHYFDQADKFMEKVNGQSLKSGNISTHGFAAPFPELG